MAATVEDMRFNSKFRYLLVQCLHQNGPAASNVLTAGASQGLTQKANRAPKKRWIPPSPRECPGPEPYRPTPEPEAVSGGEEDPQPRHQTL